MICSWAFALLSALCFVRKKTRISPQKRLLLDLIGTKTFSDGELLQLDASPSETSGMTLEAVMHGAVMCRLAVGGADHHSGAAQATSSEGVFRGPDGGSGVHASQQKKRHLSKRERMGMKKGFTLEELREQQVR